MIGNLTRTAWAGGTRGSLRTACTTCTLFLILNVECQQPTVRLNLLGLVAHHAVAAPALRRATLVSQFLHGTAYLLRREAQRRTLTGYQQDIRSRIELSALTVAGAPEVLLDGLLLRAWRLECPVVGFQPFLLRLREIVTKALTVEGVGLRIDTLIVEGIETRIIDAFHLERQPAAITCCVVQELYVVARAAETTDFIVFTSVERITSSSS